MCNIFKESHTDTEIYYALSEKRTLNPPWCLLCDQIAVHKVFHISYIYYRDIPGKLFRFLELTVIAAIYPDFTLVAVLSLANFTLRYPKVPKQRCLGTSGYLWVLGYPKYFRVLIGSHFGYLLSTFGYFLGYVRVRLVCCDTYIISSFHHKHTRYTRLTYILYNTLKIQCILYIQIYYGAYGIYTVYTVVD